METQACTGCKHYASHSDTQHEGNCGHPKLDGLAGMIDGVPHPGASVVAMAARLNSNMCGLNASWFEAEKVEAKPSSPAEKVEAKPVEKTVWAAAPTVKTDFHPFGSKTNPFESKPEPTPAKKVDSSFEPLPRVVGSGD